MHIRQANDICNSLITPPSWGPGGSEFSKFETIPGKWRRGIAHDVRFDESGAAVRAPGAQTPAAMLTIWMDDFEEPSVGSSDDEFNLSLTERWRAIDVDLGGAARVETLFVQPGEHPGSEWEIARPANLYAAPGEFEEIASPKKVDVLDAIYEDWFRTTAGQYYDSYWLPFNSISVDPAHHEWLYGFLPKSEGVIARLKRLAADYKSAEFACLHADIQDLGPIRVGQTAQEDLVRLVRAHLLECEYLLEKAEVRDAAPESRLLDSEVKAARPRVADLDFVFKSKISHSLILGEEDLFEEVEGCFLSLHHSGWRPYFYEGIYLPTKCMDEADYITGPFWDSPISFEPRYLMGKLGCSYSIIGSICLVYLMSDIQSSRDIEGES